MFPADAAVDMYDPDESVESFPPSSYITENTDSVAGLGLLNRVTSPPYSAFTNIYILHVLTYNYTKVVHITSTLTMPF